MQRLIWEKTPRMPDRLEKNQVLLAMLNFDRFESLQPYWAVLNPKERERADTFYFEVDKKRFVITRAILKNILGRYNRLDPEDIRFTLNPFGKPMMPDDPIQFNVAHSGNHGLIGITKLAEIGVDIEHYRPQTDFEAIAKRFFSIRENKEFMSLLQSDREQGFFNAWTRKEAFIKAVGMGLSLPLGAFDVSLAPGKQAMLTDVRFKGLKPDDWQLKDLPALDKYAAAFCLKTQKHMEIIYRSIHPEF